MKVNLTEEYYNCYIESCDRLMAYNYEDKGQIIFWIDKDNKVSGVFFTTTIFI